MIGYGNSMFLATHGILARANAAVLPVNTVAPAITGTAQEGQTVTCSTGTWTGTPTITYAYQWKRNGSNIGSATSSTYLLVSADVAQSITCQVTATNGAGSASATSNTITPIAAFTGLLDTYSGASVAYSLRRLSTSYTGNLIRVRRSSDNTEQNFGYDSNNVLDTAAILTFCGAGNGFVTTWYDQSGNANNATQSTAANQPQIVSSGAMLTTNGKNSMSFDGSNDGFILANVINISTSNYNSFVGKRDVNSRRLYGLSGGTAYQYLWTLWSDDNYYLQAKSTQYQISSATDFTTNQLLLTGQNVAGTMSIFKNGNTITSSSVNLTLSMSAAAIGIYALLYAHCNLQEIVFYNTNQSSNRTGIESNINTFYNIY
jgi:hypothetical protein